MEFMQDFVRQAAPLAQLKLKEKKMKVTESFNLVKDKPWEAEYAPVQDKPWISLNII